MELVTIEGVPIVRTGTYELSTGTTTFTEEDLIAAAAAWATDPAVKNPRVKIDSVEKAMGLDPDAHGGEPAFGYFDNLAVADQGQTLVADFHGPQAVADAMEWAYPSLSIEGTPRGWTSPTGRTHELVITAVALLGVHWPGVTTLDDFAAFLAEGPKIEQTEAPEQVLATMPQRVRSDVRAGIDSDLVIRRFVDAIFRGDDEDDDARLDLPDGVDRWAVWPVALRFDDVGQPYIKAVDEESGDLYRIDFTVGKNGEVEFSAFLLIVEQDVPVAAGAPRPAPALARWSAEQVRAVRATHNEEDSGMSPEQIRTLAAAHGLNPDSATEDEVMAAATAAVEARKADPPETDEQRAARETAEAEAAATAQREGEPVAARTATVSERVWQETQDRLAAAEARLKADDETRDRAHRDGVIAAALSAGAILPAERADWRTDLDKWPEATEATIKRLMAAAPRVPISELGRDGTDPLSDGDTGGTGLFPELQHQEA